VVCFDESPTELIREVREPGPGQPERYDCENPCNGTANRYVFHRRAIRHQYCREFKQRFLSVKNLMLNESSVLWQRDALRRTNRVQG
jgi:hypothetical protein